MIMQASGSDNAGPVSDILRLEFMSEEKKHFREKRNKSA